MSVLVDLDDNYKYQKFLKVDVVRDLKEIKLINKKQKTVCSNVSGNISKYIDELESYEEKRKNKYKVETEYECRRGIKLTILLPKKSWTTQEIKRLIAKYVKYIVQEEKGLKYVAWESIKGEAKYIILWIADRESYYHKKIKTYKNDVYINSKTKSICKATDDNAILKCKKGDFIKDKNGNEIVEINYFKERKSRRFIYKSSFKTFTELFKSLFLQTLKLFKKIVNFEYGKYFRRFNIRFAYNRFQRRIIKETNLVIQYIQNELNLKLREYVRHPDEYEIHKKGYDPGELIQDKKANIVLDMFEKYRVIFKSKKFMLDDVEYKIADCRVDKAEDNLNILKDMFKREFNNCLIGG